MTTSADPFSVAVICDTQNYSSYRNQREAGFPFNFRERFGMPSLAGQDAREPALAGD